MPDPCLQGEPLGRCVVTQRFCAVMAQLLKCLVVQQGVSSFLFSWAGWVVLNQALERLRESQMKRPFRSNYGYGSPFPPC